MKLANSLVCVVVKESNKLSHRQKQRAKNRLLKNKQVKENAKKLFKKKINVEEEQIQSKSVRSLFIQLKCLSL